MGSMIERWKIPQPDVVLEIHEVPSGMYVVTRDGMPLDVYASLTGARGYISECLPYNDSREDSHRIATPCPSCGREEEGQWYTPCPSDDCPGGT